MPKSGITNQRALRRAFWEQNPGLERRKGKITRDYVTDTRCAFVDWIEMLSRSGHISQELAQRATLSG